MLDKLCGLQGVDVLDQLADGLQALGLAEVHVALLLQVADQLDHVQGVDAQGVERGVVVNGLRLMSRFSSRTSLTVSMVAMMAVLSQTLQRSYGSTRRAARPVLPRVPHVRTIRVTLVNHAGGGRLRCGQINEQPLPLMWTPQHERSNQLPCET